MSNRNYSIYDGLMKLQLGDWIIQEHANLLTRGDTVIRLEKRVMAVLMHLIHADGQVLAKDALIEKVWHGASVSDHSVANAISDLRKALGDDRKNPTYIETIPKRGYRLIKSAQTIDDEAEIASGVVPTAAATATSTPLTRVYLLGAFALVVAVVLSFFFLRPTSPERLFLTNIENTTGESEHDLAASAATEMLTVSLSGGEFRLVRWRAPFTDIDDIQSLNHDRIVSGRIINDGDAAVLTLDIVDPTDGASIWAGAYPVADANFAALADSIAADLREPLKLAPSAGVYQAADPTIVETYWRARYLWSLREHQAIRQALRMLENIAIKAPNYAPAHAAIADIYAHKSAEELAIDRAETYPLAEHHLKRAFELDPNLADAFVTRAYLAFFRDRNAQLAMTEIDKAIAQQPANAIAWQTKAMIASAAGQARTSLQAIDRAQDLDPLSAGIAWDKVWHLYNAGRHDDAINAATDAKRIAPPIHVYEALIHLSRDDDQAAFESWLNRALQRGLPQVRGDEIRQIAHADGPRAGLAAIAIDATAAEHYRELPLPHAALLLALGDNDAAIQVMLNDKPKEKSWWWSWYDVFPGIAPLRNDQRLQALSQTRGATVDG